MKFKILTITALLSSSLLNINASEVPHVHNIEKESQELVSPESKSATCWKTFYDSGNHATGYECNYCPIGSNYSKVYVTNTGSGYEYAKIDPDWTSAIERSSNSGSVRVDHKTYRATFKG